MRLVLAQLSAQGVLEMPMASSSRLRVAWPCIRRSRQAPTTFHRTRVAAQVVKMLEKGDVVLEQLTVVEGSTFAELRRALEQHPAVAATLRGKSDEEVMIAIGHAGAAAGGTVLSGHLSLRGTHRQTWTSSSSRTEHAARAR